MKLDVEKCECGQLAFAGLHEKGLCQSCYDKLYSGYDTDSVLKLVIDYTDEVRYIPLQENLNEEIEESYYSYNENNIKVKDIRSLLLKWNSINWAYSEKIEFNVVSLKEFLDSDEVKDINFDITKITKCDEFDIFIFEDLAIDGELYNTPWDENTNDRLFSSYLALDAMKGELYSKDFSYKECPECGRTICEQNPANGWMTQFKMLDGEEVCNSCVQSKFLEEGIDEDNIVPLFYNYSDLKENNWIVIEESILVGHGYIGYGLSEEKFKDKVLEYLKQDLKILLNIESQAIGGLGGYISIYKKLTDEDEIYKLQINEL